MNARRAFLQFKIWLSSIDEKQPNLDPTDYGWTVPQASKSMIPTMTRPGVSIAPEKLLKLLKCSYKKNRYANQHVVAATGQNLVAQSFARVSSSYALTQTMF